MFNLHSYADVFAQKQKCDLKKTSEAYDAYNCRPTRIGVPLGGPTEDVQKKSVYLLLNKQMYRHQRLCRGGGADSCVEKDFHKCLDSIVARGMVDSCHLDRFCREDYICQALPYQLKGVDTEKGRQGCRVGFCTPTYFVFQLRLDGHPIP